LFTFLACSGKTANKQSANTAVAPTVPIANQNTEKPVSNVSNSLPQNKPAEQSTSPAWPAGKIDFKNYKYPLPRGWQGGDLTEIELVNGRAPISEEKIGASYVKTLYGDVTGDKKDEAFVIVKIETGGSAVPQIVYVFTQKDGQPESIWYFRTGDRADGGLKDLRAENGQLVVELYGQDRYIFGDVETMKITGDEEQLCCPDWFTRTTYKWNGRNFLMQGKRETRSVKDPTVTPTHNMGDVINEQEKKKGK
jgi:hypothetical protein